MKVYRQSTPAAIITADSNGCILMANEAAHRMLALESATLPGRSIHHYFPSLSNVSRRDTNQQLFRTVMKSRGHREDGEVFFADIPFLTYPTTPVSPLPTL